jgi:hypothetical protein
VLAVPEHTAAKVLGVCLQLAAVEVTTGVIAEVVEVLPIMLARLSQVGLVLLQQSGGRIWAGLSGRSVTLTVACMDHSPMNVGLEAFW